MAIIEGKGVTKHYDSLLAVDHVDFSIEKMECYRLFRAQRGGKDHYHENDILPHARERGRYNGRRLSVRSQPRKIKSFIGVATQDDDLDRDLTVYENLYVYSRYFDIPRDVAVKKINDLLSFFELNDKRDTPVDDLSGGMKRKLSVARALINDPRILIMDEPTTGLDPTARRQIWDTVIKLRAEGKTIILTTHYMDEAQELCDRIALVFGGKILEYGTPDELIEPCHRD